MTVGAILLAAGMSRRMGDENKLLAELGGVPVIARTLALTTAAGLPALVVLGHDRDRVAAALPPGTETVTAPAYRDGMGASLAAGVRAVPADWRGFFIMLGDMPLVEPALLRTMEEALAGPDGIIVPVSGGRRGNPVLWGRDHLSALEHLCGDRGGKALLAASFEKIVEVKAPSKSVFLDADTPEGLNEIRRVWDGTRAKA
ncbi:hypothetical protein B5C34_01860 [Pacificimonas flava]|uniref:MobA-like NTP transferase domain-containing protein n=2 Tax=Pacificimonas TaxID=1960290 RepID=A0A219B1V7_9SPHN|nr:MULTISPECIES: nucleotidyltransferase family protein [Pacificimonas]MBZ6378036.1 nucleotidyltransferase family protein [Pacificimonas aurantium]OWV32321.1 hypothetical protein B5C34_01860 [Pacificimonas flava]